MYTDDFPERWDADIKRATQINKLTDRFGELYRIWWKGDMYWAERGGDKLSGDSAGALTMIIADHMALLRDRERQSR